MGRAGWRTDKMERCEVCNELFPDHVIDDGVCNECIGPVRTDLFSDLITTTDNKGDNK